MSLNQQFDAEMRDRLSSPQEIESSTWLKTWGLRVALAGGLAVLIGALAWAYHDYLTLDFLASQEANLRDFQSNNPLLLYGIVFLIYTLAFAVGIPLGAALTIIVGWFFDFVPALMLASFGSTAGGLLAFLNSRYFFRRRFEKWLGATLEKFDEQLKDNAAFYLFITRLIPQIPFVLVNLLMGLSPISLKTFWWVSQVSMLPALIVFIWIGRSLPNLQTIADDGVSSVLSWQLMVGLAAMGVIPLLIRLGLNWYDAHKSTPEEAGEAQAA
ncbi:VTT domain-containing protein [Bremerella sp. JC817]|uniref:TVP38/TMEM64 family protein n=1 Tax=Bremerella sp. JC817 TaxID=3231756 RepID=UPI0034593E45